MAASPAPRPLDPRRPHCPAAKPAPVTKAQTGAEALIRCLEREGVEYVFGLSGGAAMPIFDALVDSKIKLILVRHEQGATHMADGYARATGKPGVVLVTSGPGATNTVTGLLTALMDSVPDDRAHRPDHLADARQGRLPGGRRHRHHLPGGEAQLPGQERRTTSRASCSEAFYLATHRAPRAGADRPAQGRDQRARARRRSSTTVDLPGYIVPGHADAGRCSRRRRRCWPRAASRCCTSATAR